MIAAAGFIMMKLNVHEIVLSSHCRPQSVSAAAAARGMMPATIGSNAPRMSIMAIWTMLDRIPRSPPRMMINHPVLVGSTSVINRRFLAKSPLDPSTTWLMVQVENSSPMEMKRSTTVKQVAETMIIRSSPESLFLTCSPCMCHIMRMPEVISDPTKIAPASQAVCSLTKYPTDPCSLTLSVGTLTQNVPRWVSVLSRLSRVERPHSFTTFSLALFAVS